MDTPLPRRTIVALALVFLFVLSVQMRSSIRWLIRGTGERSDRISRSEARFAGLAGALPKQGVVGYLTDVPSHRVLKVESTAESYYLAQYSLAPLLLALSTDHDCVVGCFLSREAQERALREHPELEVVRDCGTGVLLLRRRAP